MFTRSSRSAVALIRATCACRSPRNAADSRSDCLTIKYCDNTKPLTVAATRSRNTARTGPRRDFFVAGTPLARSDNSLRHAMRSWASAPITVPNAATAVADTLGSNSNRFMRDPYGLRNDCFEGSPNSACVQRSGPTAAHSIKVTPEPRRKLGSGSGFLNLDVIGRAPVSSLGRGDQDDDNAGLLPGFDVAIGVGDLVETIGAIDDRAISPSRHPVAKLGEELRNA